MRYLNPSRFSEDDTARASSIPEERGKPLFGKWMLVAILAVLQIADVATTNHVLAADTAAQELNPFFIWCMANLGPHWWLPKIIFLAYAVLAATRLTPRPFVTLAFLNVVVVLNNLVYY